MNRQVFEMIGSVAIKYNITAENASFSLTRVFKFFVDVFELRVFDLCKWLIPTWKLSDVISRENNIHFNLTAQFI